MGHCGDTIYMCADKLVFNKGASIIWEYSTILSEYSEKWFIITYYILSFSSVLFGQLENHE